MKKIVILLYIFFKVVSYASEESKIKMRELVKEIKEQSTGEKFLILQNGTDIYFNDQSIDLNFLENISGVSQESLHFGVDRVNQKTPKLETKYLLNNLKKIRQHGKAVFFINYVTKPRYKVITKKKMKENDFVGEAVPSYSANKIFDSISKYNTRNIYSLTDVTNFLYLLNPEQFKSKKDYFNSLKNTNHDMLIIEPSIDGEFFTKEEIETLKIKKNGAKRIVIAYFSIGEAEDYREYWDLKWHREKPYWIVKENPKWKGNYIIKYWAYEWRKIIRDYQKKLDEIGVDGYYLDTIDTYQQF